MCGIGGWALPVGSKEGVEINEVMECIDYRGPDDSGTFSCLIEEDGYEIQFGHRRLSILDIEGGSQPMLEPSGKVCITFNGEIYNHLEIKAALQETGHLFRTRSDTEVLLHSYMEWGEEMLERLNGQFAFVIWDGIRKRLFFARDHFGIKPFYFCESEGGFIFSSEIKVITEILGGGTIEFDDSTLPAYLQHRFVPHPRTMFKGIRKLSPGHFGIWDANNGLLLQRYFEPFETSTNTATLSSEASLVAEFRAILEHAVSIRMVADVPFGAFLSGGLDSSAIVSIMARKSKLPVKTFSVGFLETNSSELKYARKVADSFDCEHHELEVRPEHLIRHLPEMIRLRDAPVAEPSDIPILLLSRFASKHVKMVLTGEGSDEMLGGYEKYFLESYGAIYRKLIPGIIRKSIVAGPINLLPESFWRWKFAINTLNIMDDGERTSQWFGGLRPAEIAELLNIRNPPSLKGIGISEMDGKLGSLLNFDQRYWLPDNLLERGDRMTMAASLEARMPFMDVNLARFAAQLPDRMRVKSRTTKRILRLAMQESIPREILSRPKVGFRVPVREWFRDELSEWVSDLLLSEESHVNNYLEPGKIKSIVDSHRKSVKNHEKIIWSLITLELFLRDLQNRSQKPSNARVD